jgi:uncharacterized protein
MTLLSGILLFVAAMLGGALNSVAGGGSFITFPALFFSGVPPIQANATSTVALWPGSIASVSAYRREIAKQNRVLMAVLVGVSLLGGILGAVLLLHTPQATFVKLIPYLLLLATVLFAVSPFITTRLRKRSPMSAGSHISRIRLAGISLLQLIIAAYGGYFGGGIGIMMLASLGIMGMENIHEMNGLKTVLQSCINGVAVITFIIAGAVYWPEAIVMIAGAIIGGFTGASVARKLDQRIVRGFVILVGTVMTIYFFVK